MGKILKSSVLLFWLVMLGLLVQRTFLHPSTVVALSAITDQAVRSMDEWSGIYQNSRKIGYTHAMIVPEEDTYHMLQETELDLLVLGAVQRVRTEMNSYTTRNFLLKYFDFSLNSPGSSMRIKGAVVGDALILDIMSGGQTRNERITLKEAPYLPPTVKPALVLMGLEPGRKYRFPLFNPASLSMEDGHILVEKKERIKVGDTEQTVYKLKETFQGMEAYSWISEDGDTIKEESLLGYVLLKETMAEAKKLDKKGPVVDIMSLVMIPSGHIDQPAKTRYLKVRLSGADLAGFDLDGGRQILNKNVLEVQVPDDATSTVLIPVPDRDKAALLTATALIQSDDRKIRDQSGRIVAGEKSAAPAAKKLNDWVYRTIRKKAVVSIPSAVEVLNQLTGDCNEHTTLYTALARAAGIPTRMAAGIVYMRDGFYYHAWPEVWTGTWTAVDPTFGQFPADATHIRFIIGDMDKQSNIMKLVGKLKVEVLEYK